MAEAPDPRHITAAQRQAKLRRQSVTHRLRVVNGALEKYAVTEAEIIATAEPGQMIDGHGVFFGRYTLKSADGLSRTFNMFAAPEDLTDESGKKATYTYIDAVKRVAALKNWHGFDGESYADDKDFYRAVGDGSYNGGWIIPPGEILYGKINQPTPSESLLRYQGRGALRDTFNTKTFVYAFAPAPEKGASVPHEYWSSTRYLSSGPRCLHAVKFLQHGSTIANEDHYRLSCRPVRLEPVS